MTLEDVGKVPGVDVLILMCVWFSRICGVLTRNGSVWRGDGWSCAEADFARQPSINSRQMPEIHRVAMQETWHELSLSFIFTHQGRGTIGICANSLFGIDLITECHRYQIAANPANNNYSGVVLILHPCRLRFLSIHLDEGIVTTSCSGKSTNCIYSCFYIE